MTALLERASTIDPVYNIPEAVKSSGITHENKYDAGGEACKVTAGTCIFKKEGIFSLQYWNIIC